MWFAENTDNHYFLSLLNTDPENSNTKFWLKWGPLIGWKEENVLAEGCVFFIPVPVFSIGIKNVIHPKKDSGLRFSPRFRHSSAPIYQEKNLGNSIWELWGNAELIRNSNRRRFCHATHFLFLREGKGHLQNFHAVGTTRYGQSENRWCWNFFIRLVTRKISY